MKRSASEPGLSLALGIPLEAVGARRALKYIGAIIVYTVWFHGGSMTRHCVSVPK